MDHLRIDDFERGQKNYFSGRISRLFENLFEIAPTSNPISDQNRKEAVSFCLLLLHQKTKTINKKILNFALLSLKILEAKNNDLAL